MKFLEAILLKSVCTIHGFGKKKKDDVRRKPSWVVPVTHGYSVIENEASKSGSGSKKLYSDSIIVQREQIQESEAWFFGASETPIGEKIAKYIQSHLFNGKLNESQIRRKSKETMRKAYVNARAKMRNNQNEDEKWTIGSASALVISGVKLVLAHMGGYRAVLCQDGIAQQITSKHQPASKRHWSKKLFSVRILARDLIRAAGSKQARSSELLVGSHKIDSDTEFVILACSGVWEVMNSQEAVDLIRHFEDPQEAADCLAREALARMSKRNITCLVIRFD